MHLFFPFLLALVFTIFPACGGASKCEESATLCEPTTQPAPLTPTWHEFSGYMAIPAWSWSPVDCPASSYVMAEPDVVITSATSRCLFSGTAVDVSSLPAGTKIRITVRQYGSNFRASDMPFYTHLFLRFGDAPTTEGSPIHYLPLGPSPYVSSVEFSKPAGTTKFNPIFGFDPSKLGPTGAADQPTMHFQEVRIFYWQ